ncbi:MAG: pantoate--beta-alanine ligase [Dinghuibacter sp.]|nr:pantoate--beta-alanine ligase [Dinghuibacter sp.]
MFIFKKKHDLRAFLQRQPEITGKTGFVPTMGALHEGHVSLIKESKNAGLYTISSIFVNPTQFNNPEDFAKYPITIEKDIEMLAKAGCDVLFLPETSEMYPENEAPAPHYPLGYLESVWEGPKRPGHFQGVCQVVEKLFRIVEPAHAFFGLKDYQQCMVITRLVQLMGWEQQLQLHLCPTLREPDGLAMSSRNMRLNETERRTAPAIYRELTYIKAHLAPGDTTPLLQASTQRLVQEGFVPDYLGLAQAQTLEPVTVWDGQMPLVCLAAAFLGPVRLIDNLLVSG